MTSSSNVKTFELPSDLGKLALMRDQLSDYLATLERNTDAVNTWLNENKESVILGHHKLFRAVTLDKNEDTAIKVLQGLGTAASFVLSLQDYDALGTAQFGADSAFSKELAKIKPGVPAEILEDLPEISSIDKNNAAEVTFEAKPTTAPAAQEEEKGAWWSSVSNWFKKDTKREEEEAKRQEEDVRRKWLDLRRDLIALQSEQHYYVDSFMDWVGETLAPEETGSDTPDLMLQYQSPAYIIALAQDDYAGVMVTKADLLREDALSYSKLATMLDKQDIKAFAAEIPALFPKEDTTESLHLRSMLLQDFDAVSFTDLALSHPKSRDDQALLFNRFLDLGHKIVLRTGHSDIAAFDRVFAEVTAENDPLDISVLGNALSSIRQGSREVSNDLQKHILTKTRAFETLAERFENEPEVRDAALTSLAYGIGSSTTILTTSMTTTLHDSFKTGNAADLEYTIDRMIDTRSTTAVSAMYHLCYPNTSMIENITATVAGDTAQLSRIVGKLSATPMFDEIKRDGYGYSYQTFEDFMQSHVIPATADFDLNNARTLINMGAQMPAYRHSLIKPNGWLSSVVSSALPDKEKLQWIGALLEPFPSDIVRANVLHEAARATFKSETAHLLSQLDKNLVGENLRLDQDRLLVNLDRVANLWYSDEQSALRYTVSGISSIVKEGMKRDEAEEILSILERRTGFESEYSGLFNPTNIDKINSSPTATRVYWHWNSGDLNPGEVALANIAKRSDFLHEQAVHNNTTYNTNVSAILLIQKTDSNGFILVDRYGAAERLDDSFTPPNDARLVNIAPNVWVNPAAASIVSVGDQKVSLRVESKEFDEFLEQMDSEEYFYSLPATADGIKRLNAAIDSNAKIASPEGALAHLHFNFEALGYLSREQSPSGFLCHRYSNVRKQGQIDTEDSLADAIEAGLAKNSKVLRIDGTYTHKDVIDDAYYNNDTKKLYLVIGAEAREIACDQKQAENLLVKLAAEPEFMVVGYNNVARRGDVPADVININRATLLSFSDARDRLLVTAAHDSYPVNIDRNSARALMDKLEHEGLEKARIASFNENWVQRLKPTIAALPKQPAATSEVLRDRAPAYLLGKSAELTAAPQSRAPKAASMSNDNTRTIISEMFNDIANSNLLPDTLKKKIQKMKNRGPDF